MTPMVGISPGGIGDPVDQIGVPTGTGIPWIEEQQVALLLPVDQQGKRREPHCRLMHLGSYLQEDMEEDDQGTEAPQHTVEPQGMQAFRPTMPRPPMEEPREMVLPMPTEDPPHMEDPLHMEDPQDMEAPLDMEARQAQEEEVPQAQEEEEAPQAQEEEVPQVEAPQDQEEAHQDPEEVPQDPPMDRPVC